MLKLRWVMQEEAVFTKKPIELAVVTDMTLKPFFCFFFVIGAGGCSL